MRLRKFVKKLEKLSYNLLKKIIEKTILKKYI